MGGPANESPAGLGRGCEASGGSLLQLGDPFEADKVLTAAGTRNGCGGGIRTRGLLVMSQTRFLTALPHGTG